MKKGTHPETVDCTFKCACGATFVAKSNKATQNVEICSECHPFYTGKQGKNKRSTKIEKFNSKYNRESK